MPKEAVIKQAIAENFSVWITTKKRGEQKILPLRIERSALVCDVLQVSHIGDGQGRQTIPLVEIQSVQRA